MNTTSTTTSKTIVSSSSKQQQSQNNKRAAAVRQPETRQTLEYSNLTYVRWGNVHETDAQITVCATNGQGHMNIGMAGEVARKYPEVLASYQHAFQNRKFGAGSARIVSTKGGKQYCLAAIWQMQEFAADMELIEMVLGKIYKAVQNPEIRIESLAIVKLGCGGPNSLDWEEVGPLMASYLGDLEIPVTIYIGGKDRAFFPGTNEDGDRVIMPLDPEVLVQDDSIDLN